MTRLLTPAPSTPLCTSEMNQDLVALVVGPRESLEIAETDISTSAEFAKFDFQVSERNDCKNWIKSRLFVR